MIFEPRGQRSGAKRLYLIVCFWLSLFTITDSADRFVIPASPSTIMLRYDVFVLGVFSSVYDVA